MENDNLNSKLNNILKKHNTSTIFTLKDNTIIFKFGIVIDSNELLNELLEYVDVIDSNESIVFNGVNITTFKMIGDTAQTLRILENCPINCDTIDKKLNNKKIDIAVNSQLKKSIKFW